MYIDENVLKKYSLTLEEFAVLILAINHAPIDSIIAGLISRGIGVACPNEPFTLLPTNQTENLVRNVLLDSDKTVSKSKIDYESLAEKMRALYPTGKKPGTQHQWQGSKAVIAMRLKTLVKKYGVEFTEEQALDATRRYIEAFHGDYQFMHTLKYFIFKDDDSQFLNYLENQGEDEDENTDDWTNELR